MFFSLLIKYNYIGPRERRPTREKPGICQITSPGLIKVQLWKQHFTVVAARGVATLV